MHDLRAMYEKTLEFAKVHFDDIAGDDGNFQFKPRKSKMSDLEIISLSIVAESAGFDSENLLFSVLNKDYKHRFPELIERSRYNRRRKSLQWHLLEFTKRISMAMNAQSDIDIVDSVPCPIVKNSRESSYRICKNEHLTAPKKGYSAVDKRYFIGYKLHLVTNEYGVIQDMQVTPANVHDINFLKNLKPEIYSYGKTVIGDKGYISKKVQTDLFTEYEIELKVPMRSNQKNSENLERNLAKKRRRIETIFSQLCDQFKLKYNYAKTYLGFLTRVTSKLAAIAVLQKVNEEKGRPLNHIKHAWS